MYMTPSIRKLGLTAHVTLSIGWMGAVAAFLALAVSGLSSQDVQLAQAAYLAMEVITSFVILPLCLAGLLTGLAQSLGTPWGLFKHYWVVAKLLLTVLASIVLLLHTQPIRVLADAAGKGILAAEGFGRLRVQLLADSIAALVVLLVVAALGVYKPRGLTAYGRRKQARGPDAEQPKAPGWVKVSLIVAAVLFALFLLLHLTGHGLGGHMHSQTNP